MNQNPTQILTILNIFFVCLIQSCSLVRSPKSSEDFPVSQRNPNQVFVNSDKIQLMEFPPSLLNFTPNPNGIKWGGFSSLNIVKTTDDHIEFRTLTDRGPNSEQIPYLEGVGSYVRAFLVPNFVPSSLIFDLNLKTNSIEIKNIQNFTNNKGELLSGLPNRAQAPEKPDSIEIGVNPLGQKLAIDKNGVDPESICQDSNGNLWVGEEYGPDILIFNSQGRHLKTLSPGQGLPAIYGSRKPNRGFEAITCGNGKVYAMLQSPLPKNETESEGFFRILEIDPQNFTVTGEFYDPVIDSKMDKIGDITFGPDSRLYVLVQNGKVGQKARQLIYSVPLSEKEKSPLPLDAGKTPPVMLSRKSIELDLSPYLQQFEKLEGLAVTEKDFFIIIDNDFGMRGDVDFTTGKAEQDPAKKPYLTRIPRIPL